ncbi:MAG: hypothetical protein IJB70_04845 [Clostridia bacterium]|nr:hypothetical protein [Clostridia bacterium]
MKFKKNVIPTDDKDNIMANDTMLSDESGANDAPEKLDIDALTKRIEELEKENKQMKEALETKDSDMLMEQTIRSWIKDGEYLKEKYPDFNLDEETANPGFLNLLRGGADLKSAYYAIHHDEIVKKLIEEAINDAQIKTAEAIKARGKRPLENGMSSKSTALFKTDVSKLTPMQRAEIAARVAKGETITF